MRKWLLRLTETELYPMLGAQKVSTGFVIKRNFHKILHICITIIRGQGGERGGYPHPDLSSAWYAPLPQPIFLPSLRGTEENFKLYPFLMLKNLRILWHLSKKMTFEHLWGKNNRKHNF